MKQADSETFRSLGVEPPGVLPHAFMTVLRSLSLCIGLGGDQNHSSSLSGEGLGTVAGPMVLAVLPGA